jgi:hypothetical protein
MMSPARTATASKMVGQFATRTVFVVARTGVMALQTPAGHMIHAISVARLEIQAGGATIAWTAQAFQMATPR